MLLSTGIKSWLSQNLAWLLSKRGRHCQAFPLITYNYLGVEKVKKGYNKYRKSAAWAEARLGYDPKSFSLEANSTAELPTQRGRKHKNSTRVQDAKRTFTHRSLVRWKKWARRKRSPAWQAQFISNPKMLTNTRLLSTVWLILILICNEFPSWSNWPSESYMRSWCLQKPPQRWNLKWRQVFWKGRLGHCQLLSSKSHLGPAGSHLEAEKPNLFSELLFNPHACHENTISELLACFLRKPKRW